MEEGEEEPADWEVEAQDEAEEEEEEEAEAEAAAEAEEEEAQSQRLLRKLLRNKLEEFLLESAEGQWSNQPVEFQPEDLSDQGKRLLKEYIDATLRHFGNLV